MITHIVLMKFEDPADAAEGKRLIEELPATVSALTSLSVHLSTMDSSTHDLVLISTTEDEAGFTSYVEHPDHVAVLGWLRPRLANRAALDFSS